MHIIRSEMNNYSSHGLCFNKEPLTATLLVSSCFTCKGVYVSKTLSVLVAVGLTVEGWTIKTWTSNIVNCKQSYHGSQESHLFYIWLYFIYFDLFFR